MSNSTASCVNGADVWQYYGPLFLGGVSATFLSGMTAVQTIVYVKLYPKDINYLKALVFVIWAIDVTQTGLTWNALWFYLIGNFGDPTKLVDIPIALAIVAMLGWFTIMLVQSCYLHRIFCLSNRNLWTIMPIAILMTIRFAWNLGSSIEIIRLRNFTLLFAQYKWLVTLGLSFSAAVDVTMSVALVFLLLIRSRNCRRVGDQVVMLTNLDGILDSLILYTLELGSITGLVSILSLICWLQLDDHMIFVGLHISLGKLHANCLLTMLNMRYNLRKQRPTKSEGCTQDRRPPRLQPISTSGFSSPVHLESVHVDISTSSQCDEDARKESSL